ncbi:MAG: hypothetical protein HC945_04565 [Nitrosarchaeum sp.]|nr:hypothetical protein [Nitrosarchaeum sp.]
MIVTITFSDLDEQQQIAIADVLASLELNPVLDTFDCRGVVMCDRMTVEILRKVVEAIFEGDEK